MRYTTTETVTVTKDRELTVPTRWSMFTRKGNKRIQAIAQRAYDEVKAASDAGDRRKVDRALVKFVAAWERLSYTKTYGEAGDTAVRECIGDFHDKLAVASGYYDRFDVYRLWDRNRDEAYARVRKERDRKAARKSA
jgi:hypothetical protein